MRSENREHAQATIWRIYARFLGAVAVVAAIFFGVAELMSPAHANTAADHFLAAFARWALALAVGIGMIAIYCELKGRRIRQNSLAHFEMPRELRYIAWASVLLVALGFVVALWYSISRGLVALK